MYPKIYRRRVSTQKTKVSSSQFRGLTDPIFLFKNRINTDCAGDPWSIVAIFYNYPQMKKGYKLLRVYNLICTISRTMSSSIVFLIMISRSSFGELSYKDSNLERLNQNQLCYHYTIAQSTALKRCKYKANKNTVQEKS